MENNIDLNTIVQEYGLKVSCLSRRMIRNKHIALEAAQEAWFEIIKSIESFKGESSLSTWIYTVAKRTILRYSKKEKVISRHEFKDFFQNDEISYYETNTGRAAWVKEKCDDCLTAFCHCLNNEARIIFIFREIIGLSYDEISQIMDDSAGNIRKIWSRSKKKVRNFMEENCFLYNQDAECRCRIRKEIIKVDLQKEYEKLKKTAEIMRFYLKFEKDLPRVNFWKIKL